MQCWAAGETIAMHWRLKRETWAMEIRRMFAATGHDTRHDTTCKYFFPILILRTSLCRATMSNHRRMIGWTRTGGGVIQKLMAEPHKVTHRSVAKM